jgi:hypothetical protein
LDLYTIGHYWLGVANDVFNGVEIVLSSYRATSRPCVAWHRAIVSLGTAVVLPYCAVESLGIVVMHHEWLIGRRCTIAVL